MPASTQQSHGGEDIALSRIAFEELMDEVRDFLISSMLRTLGFDRASLVQNAKYFVLAATILDIQFGKFCYEDA